MSLDPRSHVISTLTATSSHRRPSTYPPLVRPGRTSGMMMMSSFDHLIASRKDRIAYGLSFFLLGMLNNVLYVVILSAALDLVDAQSTPKGVILFVNIAPALLVKIGWPYFVKGEVRYSRRILSCSGISFIGIITVATSTTLFPRLLGIAIASFSSGLGEMTYLQLSTVYGSLDVPVDIGGIAVGWFASGTGAAGLVGAALWWFLRILGVRQGLFICSFLPLCMAATYYLILPPVSIFASPLDAYSFVPELDDTDDEGSIDGEDNVEGSHGESLPPSTRPLTGARRPGAILPKPVHLTTRDKLDLARPLFIRFMLPLFFVYLAEYTINTGVAPTLIYPVPSSSFILSSIIKSLRDYYPLWQLIYQLFVFFSRSSLSIFHLPPLPVKYLPIPTLVQLCLLLITSLESSHGLIRSVLGETGAIWTVFVLISMEGLSGGCAYVNCFYHLGQDGVGVGGSGNGNGNDDNIVEDEMGLGSNEEKSPERRAMEREFRIASVGFADTLGILVASGVASVLEPFLCGRQVAQGRHLCKSV